MTEANDAVIVAATRTPDRALRARPGRAHH